MFETPDKRCTDVDSHAVTIVGQVLSGRGRAAKVFEDFGGDISESVGCKPLPGSLNVVLNRPIALNPALGTTFDQSRRFLWRVSVQGIRVPLFVYRWNGCPLHVIEIVSTVYLRDALKLTDGSTLAIQVDEKLIHSLGPVTRSVWRVLWHRRESWYYQCEHYKTFLHFSKIAVLASQRRRLPYV